MDRPIAFTSFTSEAYCALVNAGGGPGLNCDCDVITNGVSTDSCEKAAGNVPSALVAIGGERQTPGPVPPKYGGNVVENPSVLRQARIC